jgi:putative addiction module killer protein
MEEVDIEIYETAIGKRPFEIWIKGLKEIHTRAKILTRLDRLKLGNFGDCETLQNPARGSRRASNSLRSGN